MRLALCRKPNYFALPARWELLGWLGMALTASGTADVTLPLADWSVVGTGVFTGGVFNFTDPLTTNHAQRFYRVATP